MKLYKTSEKLISKNYPYGWKLKTTKIDYIEFKKSNGFRCCSITINPKTGRENKPKKSTYYNIMVLGKDENDHTKSLVFDFYGDNGIDKVIDFMKVKENFDLFTSEQIEYIYMQFLVHIRAEIQAQVIYCGSKFEDLKPLFDDGISLIVKGIKDKGKVNYFDKIKFDWDKINSYKVEGYQPFKVVKYSV